MNDQKKAPELTSGQTDVNSRDQIEGQTARIDRYSKAKRQADQLRTHIEKTLNDYQPKERNVLVGLYEKLCACGNYLRFRHYYRVNIVRLTKAHFCKKHLACCLCAIRRGAKGLRVYSECFLYQRTLNPALTASLVTLTMKNGPDLAERMDHLQKGLNKVSRKIQNSRRHKRPRGEFSKFLGIVGSIEVKKGKNSGLWHPHVHMIVLHEKPIDPFELSKEWREITGDSFIVDIQPIRNPDDPMKDFCEVFKYAVKFSSMPPKDLLEAYFVLSGKRMIFSSGLFRGVEIPEDLTDDPIKDEPYIELLYRYMESGYSLTEVIRSEELQDES